MTDRLTAFLASGFAARARCGLRSPALTREGGAGPPEALPDCLRSACEFTRALDRALVQPDEEAALLARWLLEGVAVGLDRSAPTTTDLADLLSHVALEWVEGHDYRGIPASDLAGLWAIMRRGGILGAPMPTRIAGRMVRRGEDRLRHPLRAVGGE
jgi:hypothetical protein